MKKGILKSAAALGIVFVLSLGGLVACSSQKGSDDVTVRVAFFPNITHSQALVGKAEGKFQEAFGDANKIEWKEFNAGPAEIEALFAGEVDIGYIGPGPAINGYAKSNGDLQILAGATDAGATAVVIARKEFIEDHPDLVEKFVKTHVELTDYINKNPEKAKEIVNEQINELTSKPLAKDVLDAAFKRLTVTYDPEKASVEEFASLSYDTGFVKEKPDLKNLFNLDALNKVLKEKGLDEIQ